MIDAEFIKGQKKIIESSISRIEKEILENRKYKDLGTSDEDSTQEFEGLEEKQALIKNEQKELSELKEALVRIKNGTYGICAKSPHPIERGRLKAYPAAKFCAAHAQSKK